MELYPHQKAAVGWLRTKRRGILALPMGLGKTACALVALRPRHLPVLVVCPASVRMVWEDEVKTWRPDLSVLIVESGKQDIVSADVVVTSYALAARLKLTKPGLLIFDEAHYLQAQGSARTKWALAAVTAVGRAWLLTGTPMFSSPRSIWSLMKMVGLLPPKYLNYYRYAHRFCDRHYRESDRKWHDDGASNLVHLKRLLDRGMFREEKSVLNLPIKTVQMVRLNAQLGEFEKARALEASPRKLLAGDIATLVRETGLLKVAAVVEHVKYILKTEKKVVLFVWNRDVIDELADCLSQYGVVKLDGRTTPKAKARAVKDFQTGVERLFIGQTVAAGTGITLTAARVALFVQTDWTPAVLAQAEDRIHRIGQERSVLIQYLVTRGSIEENQIGRMLEKQKYHDAVVVKQGG